MNVRLIGVEDFNQAPMSWVTEGGGALQLNIFPKRGRVTLVFGDVSLVDELLLAKCNATP